MKTVPPVSTRTTIARLLILAVVLRTFIAPGYMLAFSATGGIGLVFCDGPVSPGASSPAGHDHHAHHGDNEEGASVSPICSFWSTSGLGFLTPDLPSVPAIAERPVHGIEYTAPSFRQDHDASHNIRASPFPS